MKKTRMSGRSLWALLLVVALAAIAIVGFNRVDPEVARIEEMRALMVDPADTAKGGRYLAVDADFDGKLDVVDLETGLLLSPEDAWLLLQANVQEPGGPVMRPSSGPLGYWSFYDFLRDSDVTNDNDTDSGQSPASYLNWVWTTTGGTAPTVATHAVGGTLTLTNGASDNDTFEVTETAEWLKLEAGKSYRFVFKGKYDCTTVDQADVVFGLGTQDTSFVGDSDEDPDGVFFEINDGDSLLDLVTAYNDTDRTNYGRAASLADIADNTTFTVVMDIVVDSNIANQARIIVWVDGSMVHNELHTDIVQDEELCLIMGIQNGAAEAQALTVDYIGATGGR